MKKKLNKLFILLIIAILAALVGIYLKVMPKYVGRDNLVNKINSSYPVQFCNVIYPHIATCVTFTASQCQDIAKPQIAACVAADTSIPSVLTSDDAQKRYESYSKCFATKMHELILQKYVVQTPQCEKTLS